MREFRNIWFGGSGDTSMARAHLLHKKLERALETLSGMQQPPRPGTDDCVDAYDLVNGKAHDFSRGSGHEDIVSEGSSEVKETALDLYCALTGEEVVKVRKNLRSSP